MQTQVFIQASEFTSLGPFKLGTLSSGYCMYCLLKRQNLFNFIQSIFMFCMILGINSNDFTGQN